MSTLRHIVFDCDGTLLNPKDSRPYPGIPELLHRLSTEATLSIWTGRDRVSLEKWLAGHGLMRFFEAWRCANETQPKPHPQGLQELLGSFDPAHCAVVGDSWADMKGAKLAGAHAVGVLWGPEANRSVLQEFGADALVSTPEECYTVLLQML